jgi:hypothetical protein
VPPGTVPHANSGGRGHVGGRMSLLGMQAVCLTPKALSVITRINLRRNPGDTSQKTSADGTFDTTKRQELHIH